MNSENLKATLCAMPAEVKKQDGKCYNKYQYGYVTDGDESKEIIRLMQPTHNVVYVNNVEPKEDDVDNDSGIIDLAGAPDETYEVDAQEMMRSARCFMATDVIVSAVPGKMEISSDCQRTCLSAKRRGVPIDIPQCSEDEFFIGGKLPDALRPAVLLATASGKNAGAKTKTIHICIDGNDLVVEGVSANGVVSCRVPGAYISLKGKAAPFRHIAIPLAGAKSLMCISAASGCDTAVDYDEAAHTVTVACKPFVGEYKCEEVAECHTPEVNENQGIVVAYKALVAAVSKAKAVDGNLVTLEMEGSVLHVCAPEDKFHTQMDVCVAGKANDFAITLPMATFHAILRGIVAESVEMYVDVAEGLVEIVGGDVRAVVNVI